MAEHRLCYVEGPWAWFTTAPLSEQWGDDWNDAPYEHNAGLPYEWRQDSGKEPYELLKVAWEGPFEVPCEYHLNSPYSVQRINQGAVPWLVTQRWHEGPIVTIGAGTTLAQFVQLIYQGKGQIYVALDTAKARAGV